MHGRHSTGKHRLVGTLVAAIALMALPAYATAEDHEAPAQYRAACVQCHSQMVGGDGALLYTRKDRLARSHGELQQRVAYCQRQLQLRWNAAQIRETTDYLNARFYHHPAGE